MHIHGEADGVKFRVKADGPISMETFSILKKMVKLASKQKSNGKGKTTTKP